MNGKVKALFVTHLFLPFANSFLRLFLETNCDVVPGRDTIKHYKMMLQGLCV